MADARLLARLRSGWERATGDAERMPATALLGVLALALAAWGIGHSGLPWKLWSGDACEYAEMGRRLAHGEGFTTGVIYPAELRFGAGLEHPAVMRPPAWPAALAMAFAVFGASAEVAHAVTGVFYVATVGLTAVLGAALGGPLAGTLAATALALTPAFTGIAMDAVSETPFACWVALAFVLAVRGGPALTVGIACGLAYLTRYNGALLLPVLLGLLWFRERRLREQRLREQPLRTQRGWQPLFVCAVGFAVVAGPWWLRNAWVAGDPFYSLLNLNLYFSPEVASMHDSLYYFLQPDLAASVAMHPFAKLRLQLPELLATWPLLSLNAFACIGVLLACRCGQPASIAFTAFAAITTIAVALGLPQGRYFVPFLPVLLALGASGWLRHGGRLAIPALALLLVAPLLPSVPGERDDLKMLRGFLAAERRAERETPDRGASEAAGFDAMRACLAERPVVLAQGAARLVWETGAVAIYAPNRPRDFWRIAEEYPVTWAQMEHWRKIDPQRFETRFERRSDCGPALYRRRQVSGEAAP